MQIVFCGLRDAFQPADKIVGEKSDGAAAERRQVIIDACTGFFRQSTPPSNLAHLRARISRFSSAADLNPIRGRRHHHDTARPEIGVAANVLAAFDRLQQKRLRLLRRDLQEGRNWRQQVGGDRPHHRYMGGTLRRARSRNCLNPAQHGWLATTLG